MPREEHKSGFGSREKRDRGLRRSRLASRSGLKHGLLVPLLALVVTIVLALPVVEFRYSCRDAWATSRRVVKEGLCNT